MAVALKAEVQKIEILANDRSCTAGEGQGIRGLSRTEVM
jgi:hypothetical protein